MVDPLEGLQIDAQSYDIEVEATVNFNLTGERAWTKAWFNGNNKGETSIEITRELAIKYINDEITLKDWLARFYPKQMGIYYKALEETRKMMVGM
ncbi:MAG: hypothetical protein E6507_08545 [Prevotella bivia]|nr:hypothetical protein [Prevotella bivia]